MEIIGTIFSEAVSHVFGKLISCFKFLRKVEVTSHSGVLESSGCYCQFIKVTNLSKTRKVVLTEVWFQLNTKRTPVVNNARPMPIVLQPEEQWETWIELSDIPSGFHNAAAKLARVKLSDGKVLESKPTKNVSDRGFVAGN